MARPPRLRGRRRVVHPRLRSWRRDARTWTRRAWNAGRLPGGASRLTSGPTGSRRRLIDLRRRLSRRQLWRLWMSRIRRRAASSSWRATRQRDRRACSVRRRAFRRRRAKSPTLWESRSRRCCLAVRHELVIARRRLAGCSRVRVSHRRLRRTRRSVRASHRRSLRKCPSESASHWNLRPKNRRLGANRRRLRPRHRSVSSSRRHPRPKCRSVSANQRRLRRTRRSLHASHRRLRPKRGGGCGICLPRRLVRRRERVTHRRGRVKTGREGGAWRRERAAGAEVWARKSNANRHRVARRSSGAPTVSHRRQTAHRRRLRQAQGRRTKCWGVSARLGRRRYRELSNSRRTSSGRGSRARSASYASAHSVARDD